MAGSGGSEVRMRDGFRHRGREVTRLEAFVDAAFAFSVTLLVISVDSIPDSIQALTVALKGIPAFAASFTMIAMFWSAHANWSRRYGLDDGASKVLSLALVFLVLVYVYPLRIQFGVLFGWISGGWLPMPIKLGDRSVADLAFMFLVYGIAFATMSLCLLGLYVHAWRQRRSIGLDEAESAATAGEIGTYAYFVVVSLLSVVLSLCIRESRSSAVVSLPGMVYFLLSFTGYIQIRVKRRMAARSAST